MRRMDAPADAEGKAEGPYVPAGQRGTPSWLTQAAILVRKDVAIEVRTGEVLVTSGFFAVLVVVLGSLAFYIGPETKSQVAAALMSFAVVFMMLIVLNWLTFLFPSGPLGKVFHAVSAFDQMEDFERGIVDVRPVALYLTGTVWVLFITTRVVESRKWR